MSGPYLELEETLRPLADALPPPRPGDWLAEHESRDRPLPSTWPQELAHNPSRLCERFRPG